MIRKAASKAMAVGRLASAVFGLALVLGLVLGVASTALGANGGNLILGQDNVATALTKLTANVRGPAMQVQNTNAGTDDAALALSVQPGEAPMRVNSTGRVTNLNADKLDGKDSAAFLGVDGKARDAAKADFATFAGEAQIAQFAGDANNLDGRDASGFANGTNGKANDANLLDGKDSTAFFSGKTYKKFGSTPGSGGNSITFASAFCDPGDVVLSGGAFTLDRSEDTLVQSNSTSVPSEGWTVAYRNGGDSNQVEASVVCADFPPLR